MDDFAEADKAVHSVESQWHYPFMVLAGYEPVTKEATGFVRSYKYVHPTTGRTFTLSTGYSADYWVDDLTKKQGYHSSLEDHLISIAPT